MSRDLFQIVKSVVDGISPSFTASTIVDNGDGTYTLNTCDTLYLRVGRLLTIDGIDYTITAIDIDTSVTVSGSTLPALTTFPIYQPKFYQGTARDVEGQLKQVLNDADKMPLVWMSEILDEDYPDINNHEEVIGTVALAFMEVNEWHEWHSPDHHEYCIRPMRKLKDLFIDAVKKDTATFRYTAAGGQVATVTPWPNFGLYFERRGARNKETTVATSLLSDHLSGVELQIRLPILRDSHCKIAC